MMAPEDTVAVTRRTVQTFEFRGTLIFAQADLILRIQPEFGKIYLLCDFFWKFLFLHRYLNQKLFLFFAFSFCASCASKFFTPDDALHEWILLNAPWYDDGGCPWSQAAGGGGIAVREGPIQLRKIAENLWKTAEKLRKIAVL